MKKNNKKYAALLDISDSEFVKVNGIFSYSLTKYYENLIENLFGDGNFDSAMRLLRSVYPTKEELICKNEIEDGVGEKATADHNPFVSQFYENRVLLLVNNRCPVYCRYCFRRARIGDNNSLISINEINNIIKFVKKKVEKKSSVINEVVISGGEPLILPKSELKKLIRELSKIKGIKNIRIDTKVLSVLPDLITQKLIDDVFNEKTGYLVNHFIHPAEITSEVIEKVKLLLKNEILIAAHIPLLRGINDDFSILKDLFEGLYLHKIRPYYLIHYIPTKWTEHFRVPLIESVELYEKLKRNISGLALPSFIVYLPDGSGKAFINSVKDVFETSGGYYLINTKGQEVFYEEKI